MSRTGPTAAALESPLWAPLRPIAAVGDGTHKLIHMVGDLALFQLQVLGWMVRRLPRREVLWPCCYEVGCRSFPVIGVTGLFIGIILAVQSYDQLRAMNLESRIGALIHISLVKELGPVLAATMLAGRVGSAMAAEISTMKVTEQLDALRALGTDPIAYLVVPRFLACFLLIPALTVLADVLGMFGGWFLSTQCLGVSSYLYWLHADAYITSLDLFTGILKSFFFGAAIALLGCHRGFNARGGAEGVGNAATEAFVYGFIAILALDFLLGMLLLSLSLFIGTGPSLIR